MPQVPQLQGLPQSRWFDAELVTKEQGPGQVQWERAHPGDGEFTGRAHWLSVLNPAQG